MSRGALAPGSVPAGTLVTALRAEDGFQTAMALLAELSPLDLDTQLRAMQVPPPASSVGAALRVHAAHAVLARHWHVSPRVLGGTA